MAEQLRVVLVGAASPQWGHKISRDIIVALSDEKIVSRYAPVLVMEDLDAVNLDKQVQLAKRVAEKAGAKVLIESTTSQRQALDAANFVVTTFAQGTLEAMQYDLEIPKEYGIFQPVGDTISIGGAIRAARNIPAILSIARDIEQVAAPGAWILNLCNPMSILCRTITRETRVNTIGCCHELYGGIGFLSRELGLTYDEWRNWKFDIVGINHCGWMQRLEVGGEDIFAKLRAGLAEKGISGEVKRLYNTNSPELRRQNVKINLFFRYGVLPYSGDRHTAEFFKEFVNNTTNKGADFGVLLTTPQDRIVEWRGGAREKVNKLLKGTDEIDTKVSQEAASKIITALTTGEPFYDVGNVPYHDTTLPGVIDGAVIERMVTFDSRGVTPNKVGPLPEKVQQHLALHAQNIEDIVEASIQGNRKLLISAVERDPLIQNMDIGKVPEMVGRLLDIHKDSVHPAFF